MFRKGLCALLAPALIAGLVAAPHAQAAVAAPRGGVNSAVQNTFTHVVSVHGWAYDPIKPSVSITVEFYVSGRYVGRVLANRDSPVLVSKYHVPGQHAYVFTFTRSTISSVTTLTRGVANRTVARLTVSAVAHRWPPAGERIITVAKRYVGTTRYVDGGSTPSTGFDCSGYTAWVYSHALVHTLVHNAESQRRSMRLLSAATARPGDLVFYMSGGSAYHVAIYAGNHMQYAAATARDGIRYQAIWSSAVQYRTDWH